MESTSVGSQTTVTSKMADCRPPWGVGPPRTKRRCGTVVKQGVLTSLHVLGAAIGVPNLASAEPCEVNVLLIVDSIELMAEILG